jgi:hypothetical protein
MMGKSEALRAQAAKALKDSAKLLKLACDYYEHGQRQIARTLRRGAKIKDEEAERLLKAALGQRPRQNSASDFSN